MSDGGRRRGAAGERVERDLVLVGGGHAHVQLLRRWMMQPLPGVRLTVVVDRHEAVYSGMVPGFVAGEYDAHALTIDVRPLARRAGARCVHAAATRVDPVGRRIELAGRPALPYDVASLDVGSTVREAELPGVREHALPTRPIGAFVQALEAHLAAARRTDGEAPLRLAVVGAGAAGVELALCAEARLRAAGVAREVSLLAASPDLLPGSHRQLAPRARRACARRGIRIQLGVRAVGVEKDAVQLAGDNGEGVRWPCDLVLWATGPAAHAFLQDGALPTDEAGFVRVRETLQVRGYDDLFAAGDCAVLEGQEWVPRAGVHAVRQGPCLDHNVRARLTGRPLRRHRPQRDFLALLNLGDGRAIGGKWGLAFEGAWVHRLKDGIDRRFMRRFQVLDADGAPAPHFPTPESMGMDMEAMECGGCAAKLGARPLREALARLDPAPPDESVLMGLEQADDAAALRLPGGDVVLASVDAFRAFVDDPWLVGRVAAVNAASDVIAKGGRPRHALAWVSVPETSPARGAETLHQVLAGVRAGLDPLGVALVGGHSTTGPELQVGLSIQGDVPSDGRVLGLDGLRPGHALVLSKPLGTGVLLAADMRGLARGAWIERAVRCMLRDNGSARDAALACGVTTCTDVSGFGLAGHLLEMLRASGVAAQLRLEERSALPGARALLARGLRSTYHDQNVIPDIEIKIPDDGESREGRAGREGGAGAGDDADLALLFDPQTSGGLLMGVEPARSDELIRRLRDGGDGDAARVGRVVASAPGEPAIRIEPW